MTTAEIKKFAEKSNIAFERGARDRVLNDCITLALCLLGCELETLWCLIGSMGRPRSDIFVGICIATSGSCSLLCKVEQTFPT